MCSTRFSEGSTDVLGHKVDERGISLRFPRFIRIRDDKNADDATGPDQIAEMYERQALAQGGGKKKKGDENDGDFW